MGLATEDLPAHVPAMYMVQAEKAELLIVLRERELETHSLAARGGGLTVTRRPLLQRHHSILVDERAARSRRSAARCTLL